MDGVGGRRGQEGAAGGALRAEVQWGPDPGWRPFSRGGRGRSALADRPLWRRGGRGLGPTSRRPAPRDRPPQDAPFPRARPGGFWEGGPLFPEEPHSSPAAFPLPPTARGPGAWLWEGRPRTGPTSSPPLSRGKGPGRPGRGPGAGVPAPSPQDSQPPPPPQALHVSETRSRLGPSAGCENRLCVCAHECAAQLPCSTAVHANVPGPGPREQGAAGTGCSVNRVHAGGTCPPRPPGGEVGGRSASWPEGPSLGRPGNG